MVKRRMNKGFLLNFLYFYGIIDAGFLKSGNQKACIKGAIYV
jgi:hypothetical protein